MSNRLEDIFDNFEEIFKAEGYSLVQKSSLRERPDYWTWDPEDYWEKCFNKTAAAEICEKIVGSGGDLREKRESLHYYLCENYRQLPFFQMCRKFQGFLIEQATNKEDSKAAIAPQNNSVKPILKRNFQKNPFTLALGELKEFADGAERLKGMAEEISSAADHSEDAFRIDMEGRDPKASKWLRLAYLLIGNIITGSSNVFLFQGILFRPSDGRRRNILSNFCSPNTGDDVWERALEKWTPKHERDNGLIGRTGLIKCIHDLDMVILYLDMFD